MRSRMENKKAILALNPETGYYEGVALVPSLVQVDPDIFRRMLLRAMEEAPGADLTNLHTLEAVVERVGKVTHWIGREDRHVKVTPLFDPLLCPPDMAVTPVILPKQQPAGAGAGGA